jgi:hypothetical protein
LGGLKAGKSFYRSIPSCKASKGNKVALRLPPDGNPVGRREGSSLEFLVAFLKLSTLVGTLDEL